MGRVEAARATAAEALAIGDSPTVALAAAHLYARIGPPATAQTLIDRVAQNAVNRHARECRRPAAGQSARRIVRRPGREKAIASLRSAAPYDAYDFSVLHARASATWPPVARRTPSTSYRKILDRSRWFWQGPRDHLLAYPLAQLGLARAAATTGDFVQSRQAS